MIAIHSTGAGGAALFPFVTGQVAGKFGILSMPIVCLAMSVAMQILWTFVPSKKEEKEPASVNNRHGYQALESN